MSGGHNAISIIRARCWTDYDLWQFHRALKAANSFRVIRSPISTSRHGNDVSLIFARGGRQAQLEPGVRSEIVRAFHAGLIEWEMLSKKPQLTASRCDPQSRPNAQPRTWINVLHAPLNRRISCLPRAYLRSGLINGIFSLLFCLPSWFLDPTQENFLTDDQDRILAIPSSSAFTTRCWDIRYWDKVMLSEFRSVVTQTALASYISLDICHVSFLLHSGGDGWCIWHIRHSLLTKNAVTRSLIFTLTSYSYPSKELSRLDRQLAVADEGI